MNNKTGFNRLGRKASHRKALHRNMATSLFKHERITTTRAKAMEVRRTAEKMITRAKIDSVHNRRMIARDIRDKAILNKLFVEIGPRFAERAGGYTRVLKLGSRPGDSSEMAILELVVKSEKPEVEVVEKKTAKTKSPNSKKKKSDKKVNPSQKPKTGKIQKTSPASTEKIENPVAKSDESEAKEESK